MVRKKKLTRKDFELLPDPVWIEQDGCLQPTPFFKGWWQKVAEKWFGDKGRIADAAIELGYLTRSGDATGFGYDPELYRESLGLPVGMPLISNDGNSDAYKQIWDTLLREETTNG